MAVWLVRRDVCGGCVSRPLRFDEISPIARIPGVLSLEEYAAQQLAAEERLWPEQGRFWIDVNGQHVGYFEILDSPPPGTAASDGSM